MIGSRSAKRGESMENLGRGSVMRAKECKFNLLWFAAGEMFVRGACVYYPSRWDCLQESGALMFERGQSSANEQLKFSFFILFFWVGDLRTMFTVFW